MSQSSLNEQVEELRAAGLPVRQGTRMPAPEERKDTSPHQFGSDLWFSRWSLNAFRNYPVVTKAYGIRFLAHAAKDLPAFVVGVGPSLDDSIRELRNLKRRAVIIATDAAFRACLANGVTPDLVISYDCKDEQSLLWQDVPAHNIPALLSTCCHPKTIATWSGPVLFYNQYHEQDELCKRILPSVFPMTGQIPSGATVGNMAAIAAHVLGCSPVCVVGMDFCYQPVKSNIVGWRYRAQDWRWANNRGEGIPDGWEKTEIKELYDNDDRLARSFVVKGDDGQEYKADPELVFYMDSFVNLMTHFKIPIVNCTPEGRLPKLRVDLQGKPIGGGFASMKTAAAVEKYCTAEWQGGRTILDYLAKIVPDPRKA